MVGVAYGDDSVAIVDGGCKHLLVMARAVCGDDNEIITLSITITKKCVQPPSTIATLSLSSP